MNYKIPAGTQIVRKEMGCETHMILWHDFVTTKDAYYTEMDVSSKSVEWMRFKVPDKKYDMLSVHNSHIKVIP